MKCRCNSILTNKLLKISIESQFRWKYNATENRKIPGSISNSNSHQYLYSKFYSYQNSCFISYSYSYSNSKLNKFKIFKLIIKFKFDPLNNTDVMNPNKLLNFVKIKYSKSEKKKLKKMIN